jgi:hypothetical protein
MLIPERSIRAKVAKSVFYKEVNDIDIYIEDTTKGYKKLYKNLFSRVFQNKYRVSEVFPIGSRGEVIAQHKIKNSIRPYLFIIDGDLFLTTGDIVENQNGLFKLPFYCVENILCHWESIISIIEEEDINKDLETIESQFNFEEWLQINEEKLFNLFIEYSISKVLYPEQKTVSFKVSKLLTCNKGIVNETKLQNRIEEIKNNILARVGEEKYNETRETILENFSKSNLEKLDIVSGKDYILPLLAMRSRDIISTGSLRDDILKNRLSMKCDISKISKSINYVANAN